MGVFVSAAEYGRALSWRRILTDDNIPLCLLLFVLRRCWRVLLYEAVVMVEPCFIKSTKSTFSTRKRMASEFWGQKGVLLVDFFMEHGTTISKWYCNSHKNSQLFTYKSAKCLHLKARLHFCSFLFNFKQSNAILITSFRSTTYYKFNNKAYVTKGPFSSNGS